MSVQLEISSEEITKKVKELGNDISADYPDLTGDDPLIIKLSGCIYWKIKNMRIFTIDV